MLHRPVIKRGDRPVERDAADRVEVDEVRAFEMAEQIAPPRTGPDDDGGSQPQDAGKDDGVSTGFTIAHGPQRAG